MSVGRAKCGCDEAALNVQILPQPNGRAAGHPRSACRRRPVRVQPVPPHGGECARATPNRPGCQRAVDWLRPDQHLQHLEKKRGRRTAVCYRRRGRCLHGRDGAAVATGDLPASVRRGRRRLRAGTSRLVAVPQRYPSWPPRSVSAVQEKGCRRKADVSAAQQTSQGTPADDSFGRDTSTISDTPRYWRCWIRDDTRRLRHMLAKDRAKVLSATVIQQGGRWWVALNVAAADLHPSLRHPARTDSDRGGWVGLDRGLAAFVVAASVLPAGTSPQPYPQHSQALLVSGI